MSEKIYFHLLFFCSILCQGIFATLSDNDTRVSSDLLVRKRRVINNMARGRPGVLINEANYIVKIKEDGSRTYCAGVILSHHTVITIPTCIIYEVTKYKVLSGGSYDNRCNHHSITSKVFYYGNPPHKEYEGIVLITVDPAFVYDRKTGNIRLHPGPLSAGRMVTVYGWGHVYPLQPGWESRQRLHSINLPVMNYEECKNEYQNLFVITEKHLCTYCPQQYCARGDIGAPLVIENKLAGIHVWKGEFYGRRNPDVYINLQRSDYSQWIRERTLLM